MDVKTKGGLSPLIDRISRRVWSADIDAGHSEAAKVSQQWTGPRSQIDDEPEIHDHGGRNVEDEGESENGIVHPAYGLISPLDCYSPTPIDSAPGDHGSLALLSSG